MILRCLHIISSKNNIISILLPACSMYTFGLIALVVPPDQEAPHPPCFLYSSNKRIIMTLRKINSMQIDSDSSSVRFYALEGWGANFFSKVSAASSPGQQQRYYYYYCH